MSASSEIAFRLFGPFEIIRDGVPVAMSSPPKAQLVLAILLIEAPHWVGVESLRTRVWKDSPPELATLQWYISRLRADLGPDRHLIEHRRGVGYRVTVDPDAVDVRRFPRLVRAARDRIASAPDEAVRTLREAVDLWRGDPLEVLDATDLTRDLRVARDLLREFDVPATRVVPRQLTPPPSAFVGRDAELDLLDRCVDTDAGRAPVVVIDGQAGVGKTSLALQWASRNVDRYPDGQISVDLLGFDPGGIPLRPEAAARRVLTALGVDERQLPQDPGALFGRYRNAVSGRRLLLVLDNAADADQVAELARMDPGSLVVITSRRRLQALGVRHGARFVHLDLPDRAGAAHMLYGYLGDRVVDPDAVDAIVTTCGRLPLALAIAGARIATRPNRSVRAVVTDLVGGLDGFDTDDPATSLGTVIGWSSRDLSGAGERIFRALGRHPGPMLTPDAVAALVAVDSAQAERVLDELSAVHLIEEIGDRRFSLHDLVREYAMRCARADADGPDQIRRLYDFYLHTADGCASLLRPHRQPLRLDPPALGVKPFAVESDEAAIAWFDTERTVLRRLIRRADTLGVPGYGWKILTTMIDYLDFGGHWAEWRELSEVALATCERTSDGTGTSRCLRSLGRALIQLGRYDEGEERLRRAIERFRVAGDVDGMLRVHHDLGNLLVRQERFDEALDESTRCHDLAEEAGIHHEQANALGGIAWCLYSLGRHREAADTCERAIDMHRHLPFPRGEAAARHTLGLAQLELGDRPAALRNLELAAALCGRAGDRPNEALTLEKVGDLRAEAGDRPGAREAWLAARDTFRELDDPAMRRRADDLAARLSRPTESDVGR